MNKNILSYFSLISGILSSSSVFLFKIDGFLGCTLLTFGILLGVFSLFLSEKLRSLFFNTLDLSVLFDID